MKLMELKYLGLSSELFPHKSNNKVEDYDFDFAKDLLRQIGRKAALLGQRLTFHPGQYNVVGTPDLKSFEQTIRDQSYHADVLDLMGCNQNSVMVVHGGGVYGDKEKQKIDGVNNLNCFLKMFKEGSYWKIAKDASLFRIV